MTKVQFNDIKEQLSHPKETIRRNSKKLLMRQKHGMSHKKQKEIFMRKEIPNQPLKPSSTRRKRVYEKKVMKKMNTPSGKFEHFLTLMRQLPREIDELESYAIKSNYLNDTLDDEYMKEFINLQIDNDFFFFPHSSIKDAYTDEWFYTHLIEFNVKDKTVFLPQFHGLHFTCCGQTSHVGMYENGKFYHNHSYFSSYPNFVFVEGSEIKKSSNINPQFLISPKKHIESNAFVPRLNRRNIY